MAGTSSEYSFRRGVHLWEVKKSKVVCGWEIDLVSTYRRLKMQCLYVAGTTPECLLRRSVHLWEVKNCSVCAWLGP